VGARRGACRVLTGRPEGKRQFKDPGVARRVILKFILEKWDGEAWTGSIWLRIGAGGGLL
jgi:hypothetical protein